jgi:hypothetical protein
MRVLGNETSPLVGAERALWKAVADDMMLRVGILAAKESVAAERCIADNVAIVLNLELELG